jgi:phosphoglycerate dehydrogenase-like enzyme
VSVAEARGDGEKPVVAVLDVISPESREVLSARFGRDFKVLFAEAGDAARRLEIAREATALLAGWSPVDATLIEAAERCRVIQKLGVGVEKIDLAAARRRGIPVLRAAGINADAVADMAVLLALAVIRRLRWAAEELRAGRFRKETMRATTFQLAGRTVGLVGAGHIGRATARRFAAFGTRLAYYDVCRLAPQAERDLGLAYRPLEDLVATSDILSLHVPSTPETRGMFGRDLLAKVKRGAVLINTARGDLIDEAALVEALEQGVLLGAGLDVTAQEPLPSTSPLLRMENVLITPHQGGAVADNYPRVADRAFDNVMRVLHGGEVPPADVVFWPAEVAG